jgi:hypothetical protein
MHRLCRSLNGAICPELYQRGTALSASEMWTHVFWWFIDLRHLSRHGVAGAEERAAAAAALQQKQSQSLHVTSLKVRPSHICYTVVTLHHTHTHTHTQFGCTVRDLLDHLSKDCCNAEAVCLGRHGA